MLKDKPPRAPVSQLVSQDTTCFEKYHSLGNDFILFDWRNRTNFSAKRLQKSALKALCNRMTGVGADGILFITQSLMNAKNIAIFNQDGTDGQLCLNGLRCAADYLFDHDGSEEQTLSLVMGALETTCSRDPESGLVCLTVPIDRFSPVETTSLDQFGLTNLTGYLLTIGNPHCILFSAGEKLHEQTLVRIGRSVNTTVTNKHPFFRAGANVSSVWKEPGAERDSYNLQIYERGIGLSRACGSAAHAVLYTLHYLSKTSSAPLPYEQGASCTLVLPGGKLYARLSPEEKCIASWAPTHHLFTGILSDYFSNIMQIPAPFCTRASKSVKRNKESISEIER